MTKEIKKREFYLDFIRAIAVIIIVLFHFCHSLLTNNLCDKKILFINAANEDWGQVGVSLFFIISGAALMYTYQENLNIKPFFKKRFLSIYPMYWIAYAVGFLYVFYVNGNIKHSIPKYSIIYTVLGMDGYIGSNNIKTFYLLGEWFTGCIIIFYVCFPLLRYAVLRFPKTTIVVTLILYFVLVNNYPFPIKMDWNFLTRIPDVLFGMYFVRYIKKPNLCCFLVALGITVLMLFIHIRWTINPMYLITITGIALFLSLTYLGQHLGQYINKSKKVFNILSRYSYPIFLTHHIILDQIQLHFVGKTLGKTDVLCLFILTIIIIAIASKSLYDMNERIKSGFIKLYSRH